MAEIRIDARADRRPDLYKIIQWLKKRKIDQATAIENALYDRYMVEVLEDDPESDDADIARTISSTQASLSDRLQKLDRKECRYTPSSVKGVPLTPTTPVKLESETEENPQEDVF